MCRQVENVSPGVYESQTCIGNVYRRIMYCFSLFVYQTFSEHQHLQHKVNIRPLPIPISLKQTWVKQRYGHFYIRRKITFTLSRRGGRNGMSKKNESVKQV